MAKTIEFEATAPDGTKIRFRAPENTPEEVLKKYALIEYQMRQSGRSEYIREPETLGVPERPVLGAQPESMPSAAPPESQAAPADSSLLSGIDQRMREAEQQQEVRQAQLAGGAAGAAVGGIRAGREMAGQAAESLAQRAEAGRIAARQVAGVPNAPDQSARILQGTPGDPMETTGRARSTGFNIETAQQAARTRGAEQLMGDLQRQGAVGRTAPQVLADMPGMTSSPSGVIYPRGVQPPTTVPPRPSGLDQVGSMFKSLMGPVNTAAKFAVPPLALATAAGEGIRARQMMQQDPPDPTGATLSGVMATSGLAALSPRIAPVAIPVGAGAGALQYMRGRLAPNAPVTPEEEAAASRPAFGIYPQMAPRRPRAVLP